MDVLAIIPARGGSKGLPDKNILPLKGVPLIAYSIKAALETPEITRVLVSTDSPVIAEIALDYGAEVPFKRPGEYAQDLSTDLEVFQHALRWLAKEEAYYPDLVVQLRPTSPVRLTRHISTCIQKMLQNPEADSLRILTKSPITPFKMWQLSEDKESMKPLLTLANAKEPYNMPRQSLPPVYWQIGYLDVFKPAVVLEKQSMSGDVILPFIVDPDFAIDIDDLASFLRVEAAIDKVGGVSFS